MFPPDTEAPGSPGVGQEEKETSSSPGQACLSITGLDKIQTALPPELLADQAWDRAWNLHRGRHRGSQVAVSPPPTPQGTAQCLVHTAGPQQGFAEPVPVLTFPPRNDLLLVYRYLPQASCTCVHFKNPPHMSQACQPLT